MTTILVPSQPAVDQNAWRARLELEFALAEGKTRLVHSNHEGPLRVQRPFYPEEDGTCHVYLLHPPGGVVGGDEMRITTGAHRRAHALITNPAATKLYRSGGGRVARIRQELRVSQASLLEWLPQETIAFQGAEAKLETIVRLDAESQFVGWEILCLGRPAAGESFERGRLSLRLEVWRDDLPIYLDRAELGKPGRTQHAAWGLGGAPVMGTMLLVSPQPALLEVVRQCITDDGEPRPDIAATRLDDVVLVRYVGASVRTCWEQFVSIWSATRPLLSGTGPCAPRIWNC